MKKTILASFGMIAAVCLFLAVNFSSVSVTVGEDAKVAADGKKYDPTATALADIKKRDVKPGDWPQWAGWNGRNNTPEGEGILTEWDVNEGTNILWSAKIGSQTYGNPVLANGKVYVGTNNGTGYVARYPNSVDLGCLICFDAETGKFLWQASSPKLKTGRVHDWPLQGICCAPLIDGKRLWYVTSRGEVACLDTEGFLDGKNNGPFQSEVNENKDEADIIWQYDMMGELGVSQHNMCSCSVIALGDILFVNTSNGVDESHINLPSPSAPSFIAMDKNTGKVLWTNKNPGVNILHGQWSSPTVGEMGGRQQVLFAGGDGWLYSFAPEGDGKGNSKLLWKFDCNPKESKWELSGRGTRNNLISTPVIYDGVVYIAVGQDPEHGEGEGHLWCIDPTKDGDVSPTQVVDKDGKPVAHRRLQAVFVDQGEKVIDNPNSATIWHYSKFDADKDGEIAFEEQMHRSCGTVAIKDDILYIADFSGLIHCLDAKTGKLHWSEDTFSELWGSPLIVEGKVYIGTKDGQMLIFKLSKELESIAEIDFGSSILTTPIVAHNKLYVSTQSTLYAIGKKE